jgi:hypothetical protein
MSGGPVFNSTGRICGLVSSNMPPDTPEGDHSSYVSLIWPVLGLGLTVDPVPPRVPIPRYHVKRLVDNGMMQMLHADIVTVTDEQGEDRLRFKPTAM